MRAPRADESERSEETERTDGGRYEEDGVCARWTRTLTLPVDRGRACGFCRRKHGKTHWMDKKSGQSLCSRCSTPLGRTQCVRLQRPTLICRGGHTAELCSKGAARASVTSRADREREREAQCTRSAQCKMDVCQFRRRSHCWRRSLWLHAQLHLLQGRTADQHRTPYHTSFFSLPPSAYRELRRWSKWHERNRRCPPPSGRHVHALS